MTKRSKKIEDAGTKLQKTTFPANLRRERLAKGWSQSDLARRIWGTVENPTTGYVGAANRDRISYYENGKGYPTIDNLHKLAKALGVEPHRLAPDVVPSETMIRDESVSMRIIKERPGVAFLHVDTEASIETAAQVVALLAKDPVAQTSDPDEEA